MTNGLTLYGSSISGNCLKPKWVAERLGVPVKWIEKDAFDGSTRTPEFLALNPAGQIPLAVLSDGRTLAQSNAIMVYLAEGSDLIPRDAYDRARMFEWLFWEQYSHEPVVAVRIARLHYLKTPEAELDPNLLKKGNAALARLELQLTETQYLVGAALTLADIALAQKQLPAAIKHLRAAVAAQDVLKYTEPPYWDFPTREFLGAALLKANKAKEAEQVYRDDLKEWPKIGWSLYGLAQALERQGKKREAAETRAAYDEAWKRADVKLTESRF